MAFVTSYLTRLTKMLYTSGERDEIVLNYGAKNQCSPQTVATFNARHPYKLRTHRYILNLNAKFIQIGSVANVNISSEVF